MRRPRAMPSQALAAAFALASGHLASANQDACALQPGLPFKEPPTIDGSKPVTLEVGVLELCLPTTGWKFNTRAYGAPSDNIPFTLPGPTIVIKAGDTLRIKLKNSLGPRSPSCEELPTMPMDEMTADEKQRAAIFDRKFCYLNSTNLHTHGLHTSPSPKVNDQGKVVSGDSVWTLVDPGEEQQYAFVIPENHMAGTHWYHPHRHHATSVQAGGGMHGTILVEDPADSLPPEIAKMTSKLVVISLVDARYSMNRSWAGMGSLEQAGDGGLWKYTTGPNAGKPTGADAVIALVNGMLKPKMKITANVWYRFRFVFAAVELYLQLQTRSQGGMTCEFELLAKDGIYLNLAPRKINRMYLSSGNRADVAIRCLCKDPSKQCGGFIESTAEPPADNTIPNYFKSRMKEFFWPFSKVGSKNLQQDMLEFVVEPPDEVATPEPLPQFQVIRPCYLVDLTYVSIPTSNWGRIDFWQAPPAWKVTWTDWFKRFVGTEFDHYSSTPAIHDFKVGEVYQLYVRGPEPFGGIAQHPFHLHVIPYQITSMSSSDPYFQNGDWQDTILHTAAQAMVKINVDKYVGHMIIHCHILTHEDMGMMSYFNITGTEGTEWADAKKYDPTCYTKLGGAGWKKPEAKSSPFTPPTWVQGPPGQDCHTACASLGGCKGAGWPMSRTQFESLKTTMGMQCTTNDMPTAYAPSTTWGTCNWMYQIFAGINPSYRCAARPPAGTARLCPCNKAPTGGAFKWI